MTYKKKLIEVALPLEAINKEAAREKSIRHGHPSTLHLWWARRPLAACRAVLFASLVDDPSECVEELMKDSAKRDVAEKDFKARKKLWDEQTALLAKAQAAGISAPAPGPEPKLEEILAEIERERLFNIIRELVKWENSNNETVLKAARAEIFRSCNGCPPAVYDPFCGGGSIPLEAQRLGLEAHASDLNPVPVLITKALIEIPPKFAGKPPVNPESRKKLSASGSWKGSAGLAEDVRYYGRWMRDEAEKRIGLLYPKVKLPKEHGGGEVKVIAWVWARTVASPNPAAKGAHVPLIRSYWLSTKAGKRAWIEPAVDQSAMTYRFEICTGEPDDAKKISAGTKSARGANFVCLLTQTPITPDYIKAEAVAGRLDERMVAIVAEGNRQRVFLPPNPQHESMATSCPDSWQPNQPLADDPRNIWCVLYGFDNFSKMFTRRQLLALNTFSDLIELARKEIASNKDATSEYADAVVTYLAFVVAKSADYWSSFCTWRSDPKNLGVGHVFSRQAIPMVWDFAEGNPLSSSSGSWESNQTWVELVVKRSEVGIDGKVRQASASTLGDMPPMLFSTDPPYYDNISYANLSDFFYVWLRRSLSKVHPELFGTLLPPRAEELIADPARFEGNKERAKDFFESGLQEVFEFIRAHQAVDFPVTVFYAFRQAEDGEDYSETGLESTGAKTSTGWETFLTGLLNAGFSVDGTWPMRTELANKITMGTNILASSIVLVCRPRPKDADVVSRRDFLTALKRELPDALRAMQKSNIAPVDLAQAAIGPGMAVFSRYSKVLETDGSPMGVRTALALINQSLDEVLAEQEGEFDADTRWAVAWFDQYGFTEGPYGAAETLCTAKNTSVAGMVEAGILAAKGGRVRLLKREELDADWPACRAKARGAGRNPATDTRLTIWEITHHLIRRLEQGESGAAELIQQLGAKAEVARDLSYRLYTICERCKWASEAIAYNSLVLAWPDLIRLAQEQKSAAPIQGEFI